MPGRRTNITPGSSMLHTGGGRRGSRAVTWMHQGSSVRRNSSVTGAVVPETVTSRCCLLKCCGNSSSASRAPNARVALQQNSPPAISMRRSDRWTKPACSAYRCSGERVSETRQFFSLGERPVSGNSSVVLPPGLNLKKGTVRMENSLRGNERIQVTAVRQHLYRRVCPQAWSLSSLSRAGILRLRGNIKTDIRVANVAFLCDPAFTCVRCGEAGSLAERRHCG